MNLISVFKEKIRDWLKLEPSMVGSVSVHETYDYPTSTFINKIWHRGDALELSQLYHQVDLGTETFWGSDCSAGQDMRKIHTGLPRMVVNSLTNISNDDLSDILFEDKENQILWDEMARENEIIKQFKRATRDVLALGDGAFKLSFDSNLSKYPIIQFYKSDDVDFKYDRGRIREIIFYTHYKQNKESYTLQETYGYGYIKYKLLDEHNREVDLATLDETAELGDVVFDKNMFFAIPFMIFDNEKFEGRGQSIFEGKYDAFDSLDEAYSQWIDAFRSGKTKTYIPDVLLPRDAETGTVKKYNPFDTRYIATGTDLAENARNQITTTGGSIVVEGYIQTYCTALGLALQGIMSPATLGIDVKKLDNGEAQREKEKMTLYTRNAIVTSLTEVINAVIAKSFNMYQMQYNKPIVVVEAEFSFGEYANPSFEAVVETMSNPNTPMSIESKVEEIWGDSKDDEWKAREVSRIKEQQGIVTLEEPSIGSGLAKLPHLNEKSTLDTEKTKVKETNEEEE